MKKQTEKNDVVTWLGKRGKLPHQVEKDEEGYFIWRSVDGLPHDVKEYLPVNFQR